MGALAQKAPVVRKTVSKGIKGGVRIVQRKEIPTLQEYAAEVVKTARRIGEKGGTAAVMGGAAGVVIGAAIGSMAGAAIIKSKIGDTARSTAESIKRHADDLEKVTS